jgi:hypothetical protein
MHHDCNPTLGFRIDQFLPVKSVFLSSKTISDFVLQTECHNSQLAVFNLIPFISTLWLLRGHTMFLDIFLQRKFTLM